MCACRKKTKMDVKQNKCQQIKHMVMCCHEHRRCYAGENKYKKKMDKKMGQVKRNCRNHLIKKKYKMLSRSWLDANDNRRCCRSSRTKWIYDTVCDASSLRNVFYVVHAIKFGIQCTASTAELFLANFVPAVRSFVRFGSKRKIFRVVMKAFV